MQIELEFNSMSSSIKNAHNEPVQVQRMSEIDSRQQQPTKAKSTPTTTTDEGQKHTA